LCEVAADHRRRADRFSESWSSNDLSVNEYRHELTHVAAVVWRIFSAPAALNVTATPKRDGVSPSITWLAEISSFVTMIS
jgi:hypothetical protein